MFKIILFYFLLFTHVFAQNELIKAASDGSLTNSLKLLIKSGADPNFEGSYKIWKTPLQAAFATGNTASASFLLEHGAEIDYEDSTGKTALMSAARGLHDYAVSVALKNGARKKLNEALQETLAGFHYNGFNSNYLANKPYQSSTTDYYAKNGAEIIRLLVGAGADINSGETPIVCQAAGDYTVWLSEYSFKKYRYPRKVIDAIISCGGDVNKQPKSGNPALIESAKAANLETLTAILKVTDVNVNIQGEKGTTALIETIAFQESSVAPFLNEKGFLIDYEILKVKEAMVKALLDAGADPNLADSTGKTPLIQLASDCCGYRSENTKASIARMLLQYGADLNISDKDNNNPIKIVIANNDMVLQDVFANFKPAPQTKGLEDSQKDLSEDSQGAEKKSGLNVNEELKRSQNVDTLPEVIKVVDPEYPKPALKAGIEGIVALKVLVDVEGNVDRVEVLLSNSTFNNAAIEAVKKYKFKPAMKDNVAVECWFSLPVVFKLK